MRKRKPEHAAAIKAQIVALLEAGPKTSEEITAVIGLNGSSLGVYYSALLRSGAISRYEIAKQRFVYYHGKTAPAGSYRDKRKAQRKPQPVQRQHRVPVKRVVVRPFSIAGEDGKSFSVTLPAAPWEAAA